jgi:signal transduction histidine kinase
VKRVAQYVGRMNRVSTFRARVDPFAVDSIVAAVFAVSAGVSMALDSSFRPAAASIPTAVLACSALAWRRRRPLFTVAAMMTLLLVSTLAGVPNDSVVMLGAVAVATYSVGAHADSREAAAGGVLSVVVIWVSIVIGGTDTLLDDLLFTLFVYGGAWVVGRLVRSRQLHAVQAEDRATLAEHDREEKAKRAVAEERARIARELHDVVAHSVSVMVVQAGAGRRVLDREPERSREAFSSIEETGRQALVEMRRLLGILRKDDEQLALAPQPSLEHVESLLEQVREAGMPVTLRVEGDPRPLPPGIDLSAYRIVQEALTNALKHAGPASGEVVLRYGEDELELEISDDGRGASESSPSLASGGNGLVGMRERVALYGGVLRAGQRPSGGYSLRVRMPLDQSRP